MSLWDVQRDTRTGQIVMIRPADWFAKRLAESLKNSVTKDKDGKPWSCLQADYEFPFAITQEEVAGNPTKDSVSLEHGGDGLTKTAKQLAQAAAIADVLKAAPTEVSGALTVAQLDAEIQKRGYKPISLASVAAGEL